MKPTDFLATYTLGEFLGQGSFGRVFEATRSPEGSAAGADAGADAAVIPRCVAVKRIRKENMNEEQKDAVVSEVRRWGKRGGP